MQENCLGKRFMMEQENKVIVLKERLSSFMQVVDAMNPEEVKVEDVDRLLAILEDLEQQCKGE